MPETVILLEHPPVITLGRRADARELHVPDGADVGVVETDRGGKSTYHAPGQLVCYPILDLSRHGQDIKKYVRDLEQAIAQTLAAFRLEGATIEGLTGIWLSPPPRSEEHTSELQSLTNLVCRLLLEKKNKTNTDNQVKTKNITHRL